MASSAGKGLKTELISFAVVYVAVCAFILAYSPTALLYVGHDAGPVLDGAWRLQNHQVPHKDFASILGHGYLLQQYAFLKLFHYDFIAFAVSSIAVTTVAFVLFLSFYFSESFLKSSGVLLRLYLFLLLLSLGLGQYHFGVGHTLLTYANLYNRYGFLVLLVLFLQTVLLKDARPGDVNVMIRLVVAALLLNYLFFIKLTYFAVAAGWLTVCRAFSAVSFAIYFRIWLISLCFFLLIAWVIKADLPAMVHDYQTISLARENVLTSIPFIRYKLWQVYNVCFLLGFVLLLSEMVFRKVQFRYVLLVGFTGGCALLLQFTNWGATDLVLLTFVPVVFLWLPAHRKRWSFRGFLLLSCFFLFKNGRSIYRLSRTKATDYTELKSPYLSRFYTDFTEVDCGEKYAVRVMSGARLVDKNKKAGERVLGFSFDNPFPFLTRTVPPKGLPLVWQYATTYTEKVYPDPSLLFKEVELLLIPKCSKAESATEMLRLYGATVRKQYEVIDGDAYWSLYRKKRPWIVF